MSREVMQRALEALEAAPLSWQAPAVMEALRVELAKPEESDYERLLGELLARIHRDGGHYVVEHGWAKAVQDADEKVVNWIHKPDDKAQPVCYVDMAELANMQACPDFEPTVSAAPVSEYDVPLYTAPQPPAEQGAELSYPPLPKPRFDGHARGGILNEDGYSADQMRAYVDADRAMRGAAKQGAAQGAELSDEQKELVTWLRKEAEKEDYFGRKHTAEKFDSAANLIEAADRKARGGAA